MFNLFLTWNLVDEEGIRSYSIWRPRVFVRWEDIDRIEAKWTLETGCAYMNIANGGNTKFKIKRRRTEMPQFAILVKKHLSEEKWKGAIGG